MSDRRHIGVWEHPKGTRHESGNVLRKPMHVYTLSKEKCEYNMTTITFLGHMVGPDGVKAYPKEAEAIEKMAPPTNTSKLRRFLGMVNQLGGKFRGCKFSCNCLIWKISRVVNFVELGCGTISHAYTKPSMGFNFRVLQPPTKNAKLKTPRNVLPVRYTVPQE